MSIPTLFNGEISEYIANIWIKYMINIFHKSDNIIIYPINVASIYNTTSNELFIIADNIPSIYNILTTINDIRLYIAERYHSGQYRNIRVYLYMISTRLESLRMPDNYSIIDISNIKISRMYYNVERCTIRLLN
jgi:hypothetical protein